MYQKYVGKYNGGYIWREIGGEIFVREDILEIITPDVASKLKKMKVVQVEVSLYGGSAETHDRITGVRGSFNRTINGLKALKEEQLPIVVKCTVMKDNIDEGIRLRKFVEGLGARFKTGPMIVPKINGSTEPLKYAIGHEDLPKYISQWKFQDSGTKVPVNKKLETLSINEKELCSAGKAVCSISPQGIVRPCVILPWNLGNLREKGIEEIWQKKPHERLKWLRSLTFSDIEECKECNIRSFCTPCIGINYLENKDILRCSTNYCWQVHRWWTELTQRKGG